MSNQNDVTDFLKWLGKGWPRMVVLGLCVAAIATQELTSIEAIANATPVLAQGRPELTVENGVLEVRFGSYLAAENEQLE